MPATEAAWKQITRSRLLQQIRLRKKKKTAKDHSEKNRYEFWS